MTTKAYELSAWRLDDLLESTEPSVVENAMARLKEAVKTLEENRDVLKADISTKAFNEFLKNYETMMEHTYKLNAYAGLWFSSDTQSQQALGFKGKVDELMLEVQNRTLFIELWWKGLDDDNTKRLMAESGDLHYYLQQMRNFKPYTLSEAEEKVINLKDVNGIGAIMTLYDMITNKFKFHLTVNGEEKTLNRSELTGYIYNSDPILRKAAYDEMLNVYKAEGTVLAQIYAYRVRDWANERIRLRGFKSPIAVRNLLNDLSDEVVDTLLTVIESEAKIFHRYFKLKAKWLGVPKLRRYDLYAPLTAAEKTIDYDKAVKIVLDTFNKFSPTIGKEAQRIFDDKHIDAELRPGKRGGAFCASVLPGLTPYILMNYTGKVRDVATLAHELGHAIHALLAADHSILTFHSALPMAETASVFSEILLTERLLAEDDDSSVRRELLATALDDAYATVLRQAYFVLFEREAHELILAGKTIEEINTAYMDNLQRQFGDVFEIDEAFKWEWITVPHIYQVPFYCYAYCFGQLMVLALYQQYKQEGAAFIPQYLKILTYGGSAKPNDILSEAGIDISSPDFWRGGFRVLEGMVDELEAIEL